MWGERREAGKERVLGLACKIKKKKQKLGEQYFKFCIRIFTENIKGAHIN